MVLHASRPRIDSWESLVEIFNKKVLLCDREGRTTCRVTSTCSPILGVGGRYLCPGPGGHLSSLGGYPYSWAEPLTGLGYPLDRTMGYCPERFLRPETREGTWDLRPWGTPLLKDNKTRENITFPHSSDAGGNDTKCSGTSKDRGIGQASSYVTSWPVATM